MDAENRWWVAELLAANCEKAWLHPREEETIGLIGVLLMDDTEERNKLYGILCWNWRGSKTRWEKKIWERWLWSWTWRKPSSGSVSLWCGWSWATHFSFPKQSEILAHQEESIPKELNDGGSQEVVASEYGTSKNVWSACCGNGSYREIKIEKADGGSRWEEGVNLAVPFHGSVWPRSGRRALYHGHPELEKLG